MGDFFALGFLGEAAFLGRGARGFLGDFALAAPAAGLAVPALIAFEAEAEAFLPDPALDACLGAFAVFLAPFGRPFAGEAAGAEAASVSPMVSL